jgi:hypothetical protein
MAKSKPAIQVRAPKNADDFVNGKALAPDLSAASSKALAPDLSAASSKALAPDLSAASSKALAPKVRGLVQRADGGAAARITVYLDPDVAMKLRRHCFENGLQVSDTAAVAVTEYVAKL